MLSRLIWKSSRIIRQYANFTKEDQREAESIKDFGIVLQQKLDPTEDPAVTYVELSLKTEDHKPKYFYFEHSVLIIKDDPHSSQIFKKVPVKEMRFIVVLSGSLAIGFSHKNKAWIIKAKNYSQLSEWSKTFLFFQMSNDQDQKEIEFPPFEVMDLNPDLDQKFKVDDTHLEIQEKTKKHKEKASPTMKRERSTEILSDG